MIDTSKAKWEFSKEIKYVIEWLDQNGFDAILEKQNTSKTVFFVSKGGVNDTLEITVSREKDIKKHLSNFEKSFDLKCELYELREQADMRKEDEGKWNIWAKNQ